MSDRSFLRIGVFYDGSYFTYAQNHYYGKRKLGWLSFPQLHILIENTLRDREQGFANYKVVYSGWYQGLFHSNQATEHNLKLDRNRHHDLMHAGIEAKYVPMSQAQGEKGIDIAMAVDVLQVGMEGKIDVAVLITGDGDFVPLVRALMKHGIRVMALYFEYEEDGKKSFANPRLLSACNYTLNIHDLEKDKRTVAVFKGLFRQPEK
jgi:uncharacterized LabA/DUF88 family protein